LAGAWARTHSIPNYKFPADWIKYGKSAGPKRNMEMILSAKPDLVVAFPGSKGTADMISKAKAAGIEVLEINDGQDDDKL
jgi:ABC-type Fe3+-hydroxamate transport system substrate-binding protein